MRNIFGRNTVIAAFVSGGLFATASQAAAQGRDNGNHETRPRPPIRASATVEVIDPARGVDEIISRVRDQKNHRSDGSKEHTNQDSGNRTGGDDDNKNRHGGGPNANATATPTVSGDRDSLPPPDRSDRPNYRPDRDRRDPRRQDGDARPSLPRDRRHVPSPHQR